MNTMTRTVFVGLSILLIAVPLSANAMEVHTGREVAFPAGQAATSNLYLAGSTVTFAGTARMDLLAAGGNLLLSGPVGQDEEVAGGNVTVTGNVGQDLRVAGGNLIIQSGVGNDLVAAGGQIQVTGGVGGGALLAGGAISVSAPVKGNLRAYGGDVTIDGPISGSVVVRARRVTLGSQAVINGDFTYSAETHATIDAGAKVNGKTQFTQLEGAASSTGAFAHEFARYAPLALLIKFLMSLVAALALGYWLRGFSRDLVAHAWDKPASDIGVGFVFLVVVPVGSIILMATVLGLPLGFLGMAVYVPAMLLSAIFAPIVAGTIIRNWVRKPAVPVVNWKTIGLGTVVLFILDLIPFVGWVIGFGVFLLTLGAAFRIKWTEVEQWR